MGSNPICSAMMFVNLTPHAIVLNDGRVVEASGTVARCSASYTTFDENGVCKQTFGDIQGLLEPVEGTIYIVSALVLGAVQGRNDIVAPATGHPECIRNDKGQIVSVPGFVSK